MKLALGISIALVVALGVALSITVGHNWPSPPSTDEPQARPSSVPASGVVYQDPAGRYSITYPVGYRAEQYIYQGLGPERTIAGTKFVVPAALTAGTNLSQDTFISVELLPGAINSCSAEIYLPSPKHEGFVDEGTHRYSVATAGGAAAGNRYEEWVYATPVDGGCIGVRYFIHSTVAQNYPEGTVREFDRAALVSQFDTIRKSLVLK